MLPSILLVDDNPAEIQLMAKVLSGIGHLRFARSGAAALDQMQGAAPDLVLLDADPHGASGLRGLDVCARMKARPGLADVPVILATAHPCAEFERRALAAGAVDFIRKPLNPSLLLARVRTHLRVRTLEDELRQRATDDEVTGVANRRSFDRTLEREWLRMRRSGAPLSLMLVDVDHAARYAAHYGAADGDACLRCVASSLRATALRPADLVARYDATSFALLLPETPLVGACVVARRLLAEVAALGLQHEASPTAPHVTVSAGIGFRAVPRARTRRDDLAGERLGLLRCASLALDAARQAGRAQAWQVALADDGAASAARPIDELAAFFSESGSW